MLDQHTPPLMILFAAVFALTLGSEAMADSHGKAEAAPEGESGMMSQGMSGDGLFLPRMDPARGRKLFASKGCVVCHAINGVGGEDAPALDAESMERFMNPFDFAAKMWAGAEAMIYVQREELGEQIEFDGGELADLIAFVHDAEEQKKFSESDIPTKIKELMEHLKEGEAH